MKCELCNQEHDGTFGSGRFCCKKCASAFSTKNKREEINEKVKQRFLAKGKSCTSHLRDPEVLEKRRQTVLLKYGSLMSITQEQRAKGVETLKRVKQEEYENKCFSELSFYQKKRRLIEERGHRCEWCCLTDWRNQPIQLELDHINGNKQENTEENLRLLCPNCHAQTDTYKGKNNKKGRVM